MSGLTTTGQQLFKTWTHGTINSTLESNVAWLGGIGIIVIAIAIFPILKIGGMQLFQTEFSSKNEKVLPRTTQIAAAIGLIYLLLTILCSFSIFYWTYNF